MKYLFYILILGIVLCTFASSQKVLERGLAIRNIIWSVLALVLFYAISCQASEKPVFIKSPVILVYLAFFLVTILSLTQAINLTEGFYGVGRVFLMLVILYVISTILYDEENKVRLLKSLVLIALIIGTYGVYEYFTVTFSRRLGFMSNRNLWSAAHLLLLPFCIYGLSFSKRWKYLCIATGTLLLFNIVTLMTRSVWVSLIFSTVVSLIVFRKLPVKAIILTIIIIGLSLNFADYKRRIRGVISTDSLSLRFKTWERTLQMSRDNLLLGVGAGNWKINIAEYGNEYPGIRNNQEVRGERFFLRPHNDGLWVLSETGVIGFGLYATIFIMSLYYAYKKRNMAMFFGILCYLGFAFFSFPKERVFPSFLLLIMIAMVVPVKRVICLSPQLVYSTGISVIILLIMTTALYVVKFQTEAMVLRTIESRGKKKWQEVINTIDEGYSKYSTIDPILATPIIFYRAEAYLYLNNFKQAFEDFKRAYKLNPYHIYVISNLATCYAVHGFTDEAIEHYEKALKISPSFAAAKNNLNQLRSRL